MNHSRVEVRVSRFRNLPRTAVGMVFFTLGIAMFFYGISGQQASLFADIIFFAFGSIWLIIGLLWAIVCLRGEIKVPIVLVATDNGIIYYPGPFSRWKKIEIPWNVIKEIETSKSWVKGERYHYYFEELRIKTHKSFFKEDSSWWASGDRMSVITNVLRKKPLADFLEFAEKKIKRDHTLE